MRAENTTRPLPWCILFIELSDKRATSTSSPPRPKRALTKLKLLINVLAGLLFRGLSPTNKGRDNEHFYRLCITDVKLLSRCV